jgi:hypothetical protein
VRVACTHPTNLRWTEASRLALGRWSTVLSGGANPFLFWRIRVKVDICRSGTCICHVVRDPQLGFNRFESSLLLGYGDSITRSALSLINGTMTMRLMFQEMFDLDQVQTGY